MPDGHLSPAAFSPVPRLVASAQPSVGAPLPSSVPCTSLNMAWEENVATGKCETDAGLSTMNLRQ